MNVGSKHLSIYCFFIIRFQENVSFAFSQYNKKKELNSASTKTTMSQAGFVSYARNCSTKIQSSRKNRI